MIKSARKPVDVEWGLRSGAGVQGEERDASKEDARQASREATEEHVGKPINCDSQMEVIPESRSRRPPHVI